jgi:plasmid stabilization system protein ParE
LAPTAALRVLPAVRQDIRAALDFTRRRFGESKAREYAALIRDALQDLAANARAGKPAPDIHPDAWTLPIKQPGRHARHLFLYEIAGNAAHVYGLFYDGMDLPARWKRRHSSQP